MKKAIAAIAAAVMLAGCSGSTQSDSHSESSHSSESVTQSITQNAASTSQTTSASTAPTLLTTSAQQTTAQEQKPAADTRKPVILLGGGNIYHLLGKPFDPEQYLSYGDDTDRHPKLTFTGRVDTNHAGSYPIKASITDASGNVLEKDMTVRVVSSIPKGTQSAQRSTTFAEFAERYKGSGNSYGIDVSQWQGNIDFNAVKAAGCSFVFIRVGTYFSSGTVDTYFAANLKNALAAGLDVGAYVYCTVTDKAQAAKCAQWVNAQLGNASLKLPVAFDWEEISGFQNYGASTGDVCDAYLAFKSEIEKSGRSTIVYSNRELAAKLWNEQCVSSGYWLADYTERADNAGCPFRQVGVGRINGINAPVDINVRFKAQA
ncbi:MAG: DUF5011 domain-containing protein [Ruminococcus sp.]|nr:DUF5011 domain-containing protein [Ruminococcus sp.]